MALKTSLISHWKLEEASGTRNDIYGTNELTDNNTVTSATGKIDTSASFDSATTEYLSIIDNTSISVSDIDFTFAAWIYLSDKTAVRSVLGQNGATGSLSHRIFYNNSSDRFVFQVSNNGTASATATANNLGSPTANTWYYIVVWHDASGNTINIQVNNGTADSTAHTTGVYDSNKSFFIGADNSDSIQQYWNGRIDEVSFWKKVLTAQEKTDLYNGGSGLAFSSWDIVTSGFLAIL